MAGIQTEVSKQVKPFPATISRGPLSHFMGGWRSLYTRYGYLSTDQLRRLGNWGLPGAAKATLVHQMTGLSWQILDPDGEEDEQTKFYTMLIENANDGMGGPVVFFNRFADDILNALQGGLFETVRVGGIPVALYNVDASTIYPTSDPDIPYYQKSPYSNQYVPFTREEMAQALWYPFVEIESPLLSRTPVQMAYLALLILAEGDDYNLRLLKEVIPQAILNLGSGFTEEMARAWKAAWDEAKEGGRLQDIGLLYGTDNAQLLKLFPAPNEMGFEDMEHWYATVVCACFEMSIMDLGIMTKISTQAAAETQERVSKRQGLRHLMETVKQAMELYLLPEGYTHNWEDIDPTDEKDEAEIKRTRAFAVRMLVEALGPDVGALEAGRQGLLTQETREALEGAQEVVTKSVAGLENLPIAPLTNMMAEMYEAVERLIEALQNNNITVATFEEGMKELLKEAYAQIYEAVPGELSPEAEYFLETLIEDELGYLGGFVGDLRQEIESTGSVGGKAGVRASLYVSHLNSAWQRILVEKLPPLEVEREVEYIATWHVTPGAEHCNTCLTMATGGPYTLEQLERINIFPGHNTDCRANCLCWLEIRTRKRKEE